MIHDRDTPCLLTAEHDAETSLYACIKTDTRHGQIGTNGHSSTCRSCGTPNSEQDIRVQRLLNRLPLLAKFGGTLFDMNCWLGSGNDVPITVPCCLQKHSHPVREEHHTSHLNRPKGSALVCHLLHWFICHGSAWVENTMSADTITTTVSRLLPTRS